MGLGFEPDPLKHKQNATGNTEKRQGGDQASKKVN